MIVTAGVLALIILVSCRAIPHDTLEVTWPSYGGDPGSQHYSPLGDISLDNISHLKSVWTWRPDEAKAIVRVHVAPGPFEATPIMVDDTLYFPTPLNRVVALDATSGREKWVYDPRSYRDGPVRNHYGFIHRGVALWRDRSSGEVRVYINTTDRLISIDANTGKPVRTFGADGVVNLSLGLGRPIVRSDFISTSPPVVFDNLVIVGSSISDADNYDYDPPGDVRAYDVRTGKLVWTFHTIPHDGEVGTNTWRGDSRSRAGHVNVWAPMSVDGEAGLIFLPISAPSNDFYGGRRLGDNLFSDSIVCLDAHTGRMRWFYQTVKHDLWDYDLASAPMLITLPYQGDAKRAVLQLTKTGFVFILDRFSGKLLWPDVTQKVPPSDVPGEIAANTQPVPLALPPLCRQGFSTKDVFDLSPSLKALAEARALPLRKGPLFTPPSLQGTVSNPGFLGCVNWGGGAYWVPESVLIVKTSELATLSQLARVEGSASGYYFSASYDLTFAEGLPLLRPPYGKLIALDLNSRTIRWQHPFGDWEELRRNPRLSGVRLPKVLGVPGSPGAIVTKSGIVFVGGGDKALWAVDARDGHDVWHYPFDGRTSGTPMTYRTASGKQFVVIAVGITPSTQKLIAFSLE